MSRLRSDDHGLFVMIDGSIRRPADSLASALAVHDLTLDDYLPWLLHGSEVTPSSNMASGAKGVQVLRRVGTPLARVGDEVWITDYLTATAATTAMAS